MSEQMIESKWNDVEILPSTITKITYDGENCLSIALEEEGKRGDINLADFATTKFFRMTNSKKADFEDDPKSACKVLMKKISNRPDTEPFIFRELKSEGIIKSVVGKDYISIEMEELELICDGIINESGFLNVEKKIYKSKYARGHDWIRYTIRDVIKPSPKVGDSMGIGLQIKNNELGTRGVSVSLYVMRLACSNGMVIYSTEKSFSSAHLGGKDGLIEEFKNTCNGILDSAWDVLEWIDRAGEIEIKYDEMVSYLDFFVRNEVISGKVCMSIATAISQEKYGKNDRTLWSFINAITGVATHEVSAGVRDKLEKIASDLIEIKTRNEFVTTLKGMLPEDKSENNEK